MGVNYKKEESYTKATSMLSTGALSTGMGVTMLGLMKYFPLISEELSYVIPVGLIGVGLSCFDWYRKAHHKFYTLFKNLQLGSSNFCFPLLKTKEKTGNATVYKFTMPAGVSLSDFLEKKEAIEQFCGYPVEFSYEFKTLVMKVFDAKIKTNYPYEYKKLDAKVPIIVGYNHDDCLIYKDMSDSTTPHAFIAGSTGGGKSTLLRAIITQIILQNDEEDNIDICLVDLKNGCEFCIFENCKYVSNFCTEEQDLLSMLTDLCNETTERYKKMSEKKVSNVDDYNHKSKDDHMKHKVLIIDEVADVAKNTAIQKKLAFLGRKARACGIHLILSTQRPDKDSIDSNVKNNIPMIIGMQTSNKQSSNVIMEDAALHKLRGKGHCILKVGSSMNDCQAPNLSQDEAVKLIKHTYIEKTPVQKNKPVKKKKVKSNIDFADIFGS